MPLDSLVANPGRLRILTSLAVEPSQEFVRLRAATKLTDGNLSTHAKRLHGAGLLAIEKHFRAGKPVTTITLTPHGRLALESHVRGLVEAMSPSATREEIRATVMVEVTEDEWVD